MIELTADVFEILEKKWRPSLSRGSSIASPTAILLPHVLLFFGTFRRWREVRAREAGREPLSLSRRSEGEHRFDLGIFFVFGAVGRFFYYKSREGGNPTQPLNFSIVKK